jgi:hypothetical protein
MQRIRLTSCAGALLALAACQDGPTGVEQPAAVAQPSLAKGKGPDLAAEFAKLRPYLVQAVSSRGGGNGALFIQTTMTTGIFLFDGTALCGATQVNRANGAFYRLNPDGTLTAKLSDAGADLWYTPDFFGTTYSGTGSFQFHATGVPTIFDTGLPGFVIIIVDPPYRGPLVARGVGRVVQDGTTGPSALLRCSVMDNPDGTRKKLDITLH